MRLLLLWLLGFALALAWRAEAILRQLQLPELAGASGQLMYQAVSSALWGTGWVVLALAIALGRLRAKLARVTIILMLLYHAQQWMDTALLARSDAAAATFGFRALLSVAALSITTLLAWRAGREAARAAQTGAENHHD